eukprot:Rhum_TRINITY_DN15221_c10_g1::Rhum_TRINITY_DN15221_c10_g1_i1::g.143779::m.143779
MKPTPHHHHHRRSTTHSVGRPKALCRLAVVVGGGGRWGVSSPSSSSSPAPVLFFVFLFCFVLSCFFPAFFQCAFRSLCSRSRELVDDRHVLRGVEGFDVNFGAVVAQEEVRRRSQPGACQQLVELRVRGCEEVVAVKGPCVPLRPVVVRQHGGKLKEKAPVVVHLRPALRKRAEQLAAQQRCRAVLLVHLVVTEELTRLYAPSVVQVEGTPVVLDVHHPRELPVGVEARATEGGGRVLLYVRIAVRRHHIQQLEVGQEHLRGDRRAGPVVVALEVLRQRDLLHDGQVVRRVRRSTQGRQVSDADQLALVVRLEHGARYPALDRHRRVPPVPVHRVHVRKAAGLSAVGHKAGAVVLRAEVAVVVLEAVSALLPEVEGLCGMLEVPRLELVPLPVLVLILHLRTLQQRALRELHNLPVHLHRLQDRVLVVLSRKGLRLILHLSRRRGRCRHLSGTRVAFFCFTILHHFPPLHLLHLLLHLRLGCLRLTISARG